MSRDNFQSVSDTQSMCQPRNQSLADRRCLEQDSSVCPTLSRCTYRTINRLQTADVSSRFQSVSETQSMYQPHNQTSQITEISSEMARACTISFYTLKVCNALSLQPIVSSTDHVVYDRYAMHCLYSHSCH